MTHLRSRETIPKTPLKTLRNRIIEPSTPRKSHEPSHHLPSPSVMISSPSSFSSPDQKSVVLDSASGSGTAPRRSLRLASKSKVGDDDSGKVLVSGSRRGRRRRIAGGNAVGMNAKKDGSSDSDSENLKGESARVLDSRGKRVRVSDSSVEKARVSGEGDLGNVVIEKQMMGFAEEEDGVLKENEMDLDSLGDGEGGEIKEKCGSNISKLGSSSDLASLKDIDLNWPPSNSTAGDGDCNGFLNLRSRAGFAKRKMMEIGVDSNGIVNGDDRLVLNEREGGGERRENEGRLTCGSGEVIDLEKLKSDRSSDEITPFKGETRYSREEKGKRKLTKESWLSIGIDPVELDLDPEAEHLIENAVSGLSLPETSDHLIENAVSDRETLPLDKKQMAKMRVKAKATRRRGYRERFLDTARQNASRFAHFQAEGEEDNNVPPDRERGMPSASADEEIEDWPGPFSTAMKIINDRTMKPNGRQESTSSGVSKPVPVIEWMPKKEQFHHSKLSVPSLQDLCLSILAKNADALISLTHVPDVLKHKLSQMLCDSRRMDSHFMDLLVSGCPTEIRVKDCSWITEEQIKKTLEGCNKQNIVVLQLDQCGRCMPDYILRDTLARLPNSLPALTTICLKGACRLSDVGLKALVASAPAIRSINLGQCSLLTSTGIITLADSLGSVLRELYIDDCPNIDAMLILPALKKIEHLEVLSVASVSTVCDDFVSGLIAIHGPNMKELVLSDCKELTDTSIKAIAETCSGLCALDLYNLYKLTDCAIRYLANGCRSIQKLKLRRNPFSDEAIAAFLEASGESLTELSLNNITKVGHNTAISLARRSRKLLSLDLSFCRNLTDEALGLIVDSCLSLKLLRLFGCTQITNVFLDGHSNPHVRIIGLKMTPILECLDTLDCLEAPLRYSSFSF